MLLPLYVSLAIAVVFYAVLPVVGAYISRAQWRRFRSRLLELSLSPRLRLDAWAWSEKDGPLEGRHRFFGEVEAVEGEDRVWIKGRDLTAIVELARTPLYILEGEDEDPERRAEPSLVQRVPWSRVRVFPEGAKVFVGGVLRVEAGKPTFHSTPEEPLLVVTYSGSEANLLSRLIAGGRRGNEYWNPLSRISLAAGMGLVAIFLSFAFREGYFPTVLFLSLLTGFAPVLCLLPPGLLFFFLYSRWWRRGLEERVSRDLFLLPLRFSQQGTPSDDSSRIALPEGGWYLRRSVDGQPPPGIPVLLPRTGTQRGHWTVFTVEGSSDPGVRAVAIAGDPASLAHQAEGASLLYTAIAGVSIVAALVVNLVAAFLAWRFL